MTDKKELNSEELDNVAGGRIGIYDQILQNNENIVVPVVEPGIKDIITGPGGVMDPKPTKNEPPKITRDDSSIIR